MQPPPTVLRGPADLSAAWLGQVLGRPVEAINTTPGEGAWSHQHRLAVALASGERLALRLKVCLGHTFGRSEVDYYLHDYTTLRDAPLVRCWHAAHDPALGYHLLLDDLAGSHADQRDTPPTPEHAVALAQALARLHAHHWQSQPAPAPAALQRWLDACAPGLAPLQADTGQALHAHFAQLQAGLRRRWAQPQGMSLLHGDANPTNVLAPRGQPGPVLLLDRQPFDWSLTYGVALFDLAYASVPWWPEPFFQAQQLPMLRAWHATLGRTDYPWAQVLADWPLAVAQCLAVPLEWCAEPEAMQRMRWLWTLQLQRVLAAMQAVNAAG